MEKNGFYRKIVVVFIVGLILVATVPTGVIAEQTNNWYKTEKGIKNFAKMQCEYYGAVNYDYFIQNNYVLIVLYTGDALDNGMPRVNLIIFDKNKAKFIADAEKGYDLYLSYYLHKNKENLASVLSTYAVIPQYAIDVIKDFANSAYIEVGTSLSDVVRGGKVLAGCLVGGVAGPGGCAAGALLAAGIQAVDTLETETGIEVEYVDIVTDVQGRTDEMDKAINEMHSLLKTAKTLDELHEGIQTSVTVWKMTKEMKKAKDLMALSRVDTIRVLQEAITNEGMRQMKFTLTATGVALLDLFLDPGSIKRTSKFASLAGLHAETSEILIKEAKDDIVQFKKEPTIENYESVIKKLSLAYDNLAIGYYLEAASIESCKDSPTGWIAAWIHDQTSKGFTVEEQINNCRESARDKERERTYLLTKYMTLPLYVAESINYILIPGEPLPVITPLSPEESPSGEEITKIIDEMILWWNENKDELIESAHELIEAFFDFVDELISEYEKEK